MDRGEFLSILRESLEGFIPMEEVETNIDYYRNYFEEASQSDKEVIDELGDPRLIARTIIDAYKASKGPMADYYTEQARSEYSREHSEQPEEEGVYYQYGRQIKWYERLVFWAVILILFVVGITLIFTVAGIFVGYVLPVILLVVLIRMLMNHFRK